MKLKKRFVDLDWILAQTSKEGVNPDMMDVVTDTSPA